MPSTKENAISAIETSINVLRAARGKVEDVIAQKDFDGDPHPTEDSKLATLNRKIGDLRDLKIELQAANTVVSAPSVQDIANANGIIRQINDIAVSDAALSGGLNFIQSAIASARQLRTQVAMG